MFEVADATLVENDSPNRQRRAACGLRARTSRRRLGVNAATADPTRTKEQTDDRHKNHPTRPGLNATHKCPPV